MAITADSSKCEQKAFMLPGDVNGKLSIYIKRVAYMSIFRRRIIWIFLQNTIETESSWM